MTTAVYILSPNDKIDSFASQAQELEYDARKVLVGPSDGDVRTVVFLDGSPTELKNAIANDKEAKLLLEKLKSRVENMLKVVRVGYEDLNVFVHFRNQGSDELPNFNKKLKTLTADYSFFRCYAISFGNTYPPSLFPNSIFSPPNGDGFVKICNEINNGGLDELEHLRALRLMSRRSTSIIWNRFCPSWPQPKRQTLPLSFRPAKALVLMPMMRC